MISELDRWTELNNLLRDLENNRLKLHDYVWRLQTRFRMNLSFAADGLPHAVQVPVNQGTHPPYWMVYTTLPGYRDLPPLEVRMEGQALISSAVRIRGQILGLFPEAPKELLFPLYLKG